jgi:hypothetical protein
MPACEQCGAPCYQALKIERGNYTVSQSVCSDPECLAKAAANCIGLLEFLTDEKGGLGLQSQNEDAPPESGRRRINHLRVIQ